MGYREREGMVLIDDCYTLMDRKCLHGNTDEICRSSGVPSSHQRARNLNAVYQPCQRLINECDEGLNFLFFSDSNFKRQALARLIMDANK